MSPRPLMPLPMIFLLWLLLLITVTAKASWQNGTERPTEHEPGGDQAQHRHRWRRAPAVWGEPAPDYSMAALDRSTHIYLYALLFVDLKTSDHYRREHQMVKREVMRLAREANNYFYQVNLRLVVVDVLETFRDDLSLYSFEQYRNQRLAQLPFHNFAVLITYRYAGGLAFVGGMCSTKSVMLAGFYPHNPEAMASIFFHEVAHLVGVPHRPANETLEVPNCACPRQHQQHHYQQLPSATFPPPIDHSRQNSSQPMTTTGQPNELVSGASLMLDGRGQSPGCLKIPGFDQDCTLQLMVNLAMRTRCLAREPRLDTESLPLCGNGLREGNEQCDCGLASKCQEWNCEAGSCSRRYPLWQIWLSALGLCLAVACPLVLCLWLHQQSGRLSWPSAAKSRRLAFARLPLGPPSIGKKPKVAFSLSFQPKQPNSAALNNSKIERILRRLFAQLARPFRAIWERLKQRVWRRQEMKSCCIESALMSPPATAVAQIRRPRRPPPPPPPLINEIRSPTSTLSRPKKPPPPLPLSLPVKSPMIRPKAMPPEPPPINRPILDCRVEDDEEEEEDEWDDYCE